MKRNRSKFSIPNILRWAGFRPVIVFALCFLILSASFVSCKNSKVTTQVPIQTTNSDDAARELGFAAGDTAPTFALSNINNRVYNLENYKGLLVILTFWSNNCATCLTGLNELNKLYAKYRIRKLAVISVNIDTKANHDEVFNFTKNNKLSFPVLLDDEREVSNLYKVKDLPEAFVIDPEGKFISIVDPVWADDSIRITSDYPWNSQMYSQIIEDLLNKYFGEPAK